MLLLYPGLMLAWYMLTPFPAAVMGGISVLNLPLSKSLLAQTCYQSCMTDLWTPLEFDRDVGQHQPG